MNLTTQLPDWILNPVHDCNGQKISHQLRDEDWLTNPEDAEEDHWLYWSDGSAARINEIEVCESTDVYYYVGGEVGDRDTITPGEIRRNPDVVVV